MPNLLLSIPPPPLPPPLLLENNLPPPLLLENEPSCSFLLPPPPVPPDPSEYLSQIRPRYFYYKVYLLKALSKKMANKFYLYISHLIAEICSYGLNLTNVKYYLNTLYKKLILRLNVNFFEILIKNEFKLKRFKKKVKKI